MDGAGFEVVGLFVAIAGQFGLLFTMNNKLNRILFEQKLCPYHKKITKQLE